MEAGLDIVSGMHGQLADRAELAEAATRFGRRLIDRRSRDYGDRGVLIITATLGFH